MRESYDLFEQLILYWMAADFVDGISWQPLSQIWTHWNSCSVICKPADGAAGALFYDSRLSATEHYLHALKLESELKAVFAGDAADGYKSLYTFGL